MANINDKEREEDMDDDTLLNAFANIKREEKYLTDTAQIKTDIQNAATIMSYIVDKGLDIKREHLETIVESREKYHQGKWTKADEIKFYLTYTELTKIIKPVTVDSLTSSRPSSIAKVGKIGSFFGRTQKMPLSKRSATGYTLSTLFFVIVLLVIQIYFYLGSTRLNDINECSSEAEKLYNRINELTILVNSDPDNMQFQLEQTTIMERLDELEKKRLSNIVLLDPWVKYVRNFTFKDQKFATDETVWANDTKREAYSRAKTAVVQEAKNYVLILGIYVLPLIYGIIGGFTFVLRELNTEIKELTFSSGSNIKYLLRILLGAIAGLSIGLFWGDIQKAEQFGLTSLSPMLLAFLGGYCVEYLLQFFEKITHTFFNKHLDFYEKQPVEPKPRYAKPAESEPAKTDAAEPNITVAE